MQIAWKQISKRKKSVSFHTTHFLHQIENITLIWGINAITFEKNIICATNSVALQVLSSYMALTNTWHSEEALPSESNTLQETRGLSPRNLEQTGVPRKECCKLAEARANVIKIIKSWWSILLHVFYKVSLFIHYPIRLEEQLKSIGARCSCKCTLWINLAPLYPWWISL